MRWGREGKPRRDAPVSPARPHRTCVSELLHPRCEGAGVFILTPTGHWLRAAPSRGAVNSSPHLKHATQRELWKLKRKKPSGKAMQAR